MQKKLIFDSDLLDITLTRLCEQLIENHTGVAAKRYFSGRIDSQKIKESH
jgi:hypothetical protein